MSSKLMLLIATVAVFSLIACAQPEPETSEPAPAPADDEADAIVVDSAHYTAELENERVRIVRIAYGAGEESVMHHHPDSVAVFLTDHLVQMTMPDGSTEQISANAGEAIFIPSGQHLPKNISDAAWELVLVELRQGEPSSADAEGPDAIAVDPGHYTAEFENDSIRLVRIAYGAGEESVMHYHPDSVAVFLTDHLVQMTTPDGSQNEIGAKAGEAIFLPGGQHLPKNISEEAWELMLIELK